MIKKMVKIQQGKMQMASELHKMKTFYCFENSNYFWKEIQDVVLKVDIFGRFFFNTYINLTSYWKIEQRQ